MLPSLSRVGYVSGHAHPAKAKVVDDRAEARVERSSEMPFNVLAEASNTTHSFVVELIPRA